MSVQQFFRQIVNENFPTYAPSLGWDGKSLKLDSGENLWAPKLQFDWEQISKDSACYPDSTAKNLRTAIAKDLNLDPSFIVVGNGSDELIDLTCRLFLDKDDRFVDFSPTFPMFFFFGKLCGAQIIDVPRMSDFQIDVERAKIELKKSKLAFVANPNNPTGTVISREATIKLLQTGTPLVIDEAYIEFGGRSVIDLLSKFENLIVLRTFSKWAGIAGLRVGFLIANPIITERINAIKPPYNVNIVAQTVAIKVLENKAKFSSRIQEIKESRDWFIEEVNMLQKLTAIPSQASCVTILCKDMSAKEIAKGLVEQGIMVKILPESMISNSLRISIAPKDEMKRVLDTLKKIVQS